MLWKKLVWGRVKWAHADLRVLIEAPEDLKPKPGLDCHVGIYFRVLPFGTGARSISAASAGFRRGKDCRGRGLCRPRAERRHQDPARPRGDPSLRCCSASRIISPPTRPAAGTHWRARSMPSNRRDGFVSRRWRRSCSILPARRATASSTYAACHGDPCVRRGWLATGRAGIICWP